MLRKTTLLQSVSRVRPSLAPLLKIDRWCIVKGPTLGQQQYSNCWNFSVGPMLGQCQHANNDVLPTTPTITQPWPNDCLLSRFYKKKNGVAIVGPMLFNQRNKNKNIYSAVFYVGPTLTLCCESNTRKCRFL